MITLMLALLAVAPLQDKNEEQEKTLEQRLDELEKKLTELEKRRTTVEAENKDLEKKIETAKARKKKSADMMAANWVVRYEKVAKFTDEQKTGITKLLSDWHLADFDKKPEKDVWTEREKKIRGELDKEQLKAIALKNTSDQEKTARNYVTSILRMAKVEEESWEAVGDKIVPKLTLAKGVVLQQAHPTAYLRWNDFLKVMQDNLSDLEDILSEEEHEALTKVVEKYASFNNRKK